ncbi:MAG: hypothetical protein HC846_03130 [Blastocatellia bacterium]|nr:hypothetical protein [Blastocatellia bacterium]
MSKSKFVSSDGGCDPQAVNLKQADVIKNLEDGTLAELYILRYFEVKKK